MSDVDIAPLVAELRQLANHRAEMHNVQPHAATRMDAATLPEAVAADKIEILSYQLNEILGAISEYGAMPCDSLRKRVFSAAEAAQRGIMSASR